MSGGGLLGTWWAWRVAAITACLSISARSSANDDRSRLLPGLALDYQVLAEACPSRGEFLRQVEAAMQSPPMNRGVTRRLRVRLAVEGRRVRGTVGVARSAGWLERSVTGQTCDEVVLALALASALALDFDAGVPRAGAPVPPPQPEPAFAPTVSPPVQRVPTPSDRSTPIKGRPNVDPTWRVGAGAALRTAPAPGLSLELRAHADARFASLPVWFGAGVSRLTRSEGRTSEFEGWLASTGVSVEPWMRWGLTLGWCVVAELGVVHASGRELTNPEPQVRPWAALGTGPTLRWNPLTPIFFELWFMGMLPLFQQRYLAATPQRALVVVHETPSLGYWVGFGLGAFL
jgi:hypothetical protein